MEKTEKNNETDKIGFELYKLAIEARDKLNDNYHKWMTFYYVANSAFLVAFATIYTQMNTGQNIILLILPILGILISIFWHLSCKGYYYWSNSWINIIIKHEQKILEKPNDNSIGVYSVFSKEIYNKEIKNCILNPLSFANISTPKLTLLFSFIAIISWSAISISLYSKQFCNLSIFLIVVTPILITVSLFLLFFLKDKAKSLIEENSHQFI